MKRDMDYIVTIKPKMDPEKEIVYPVVEATVIIVADNIELAMIHAWETVRLNSGDYEIVSVHNMGRHKHHEKESDY